jgi:3-oxoadipate enol-lactonase
MTVSTAGSPLAWDRRGDGPALLFLPGAGADLTAFGHQVRAFSPRFTCLAPRWPQDAQRPEDLAARLAASLPSPLVGIVAHSMGAAVALHLARSLPPAVPLVLLSPWAGPDIGLDMLLAWLESLVARLAPAEYAPGLLWLLASPGLLAKLGSPAPLLSGMFTGPRAPSPAALRAHFRIARAHDARSWLREIACPTLVLAGAHDRMVPWPLSREVADLLPRARFRLVRGAGHLLHFEQPQRVTACIADHLGA